MSLNPTFEYRSILSGTASNEFYSFICFDESIAFFNA